MKIIKIAAMSWILEQNDFSNSESPCHPNGSHQVFSQSDLPFGSSCGLKIFKIAGVAAILDIGMELFKHCLPSSFCSIQLKVWKEMWFEHFQDGWNDMILAILNLHVAPMPPTKFQLNRSYDS